MATRWILIFLSSLTFASDVADNPYGYWRAYEGSESGHVIVKAYNLGVDAPVRDDRVIASSNDHDELYNYLCDRGYDSSKQHWYTHNGEKMTFSGECGNPEIKDSKNEFGPPSDESKEFVQATEVKKILDDEYARTGARLEQISEDVYTEEVNRMPSEDKLNEKSSAVENTPFLFQIVRNRILKIMTYES